jgi:hypothetical protein
MRDWQNYVGGPSIRGFSSLLVTSHTAFEANISSSNQVVAGGGGRGANARIGQQWNRCGTYYVDPIAQQDRRPDLRPR